MHGAVAQEFRTPSRLLTFKFSLRHLKDVAYECKQKVGFSSRSRWRVSLISWNGSEWKKAERGHHEAAPRVEIRASESVRITFT